MGTIQDQIKALQRRQAKIDRYKHIQSVVKGLEPIEDHEDLHKEIEDEVVTLLEAEIEKIEQPELARPELPASTTSGYAQIQVQPAVTPNFTPSEFAVLREFLDRALKRRDETQLPVTQKPSTPKLDPNDKVRFLTSHRKFDGKRVELNTPNGKVEGTVRGLDAPHLIVETDTGYTIPIEPDRVRIIN